MHSKLDKKILITIFLQKWITLGVLFFLPVIFLLFLYPSTHNYNSLDVVQTNIKDVDSFTYIDKNKRLLKYSN